MSPNTTPWPAGGIKGLPIQQQREAVRDQLFRMFVAAKDGTPEEEALARAYAELNEMTRIPSEAC